jgi:hypothetical protein
MGVGETEDGRMPTRLTIEIEREEDGRFIAEVPELPGTMAYGQTREEATARAQALALRGLRRTLDSMATPCSVKA